MLTSQKPSVNEYVLNCESSDWQKRFEEEYYNHLSRLTGLKMNGYRRPKLWGKITKELIYDYLPEGVYDALKTKATKSEQLHQYLTPKGVKELKLQQELVLDLAKQANTVDELYRLIDKHFSRLAINYLGDKTEDLCNTINDYYEGLIEKAKQEAILYGESLLSNHISDSRVKKCSLSRQLLAA